MKQSRGLIVVVISFLISMISFVGGCSASNNLTRDKAKKMMESSKEFQTQSNAVRLDDADIKRGEAAGYWHEDKEAWVMRYFAITPEGKRLFGGWVSGRPDQILNLPYKLSRHVVEVTGITDEEGSNGHEKLVTFTWNWNFDGMPPEVKQFFQNYPPRKYCAEFRLYDDGWRLEKYVSEEGTTDPYWQ